MNQLHILTAPNGKHLLVGDKCKAIEFAMKYGPLHETLDSETLALTHHVEVSWLADNGIKKVIQL